MKLGSEEKKRKKSKKKAKAAAEKLQKACVEMENIAKPNLATKYS